MNSKLVNTHPGSVNTNVKSEFRIVTFNCKNMGTIGHTFDLLAGALVL